MAASVDCPTRASAVTTQREIARRAKTSLKTVSRVINRDPLVNSETRARIEAIIAEIGYEPSQAARMMRSQRSNIIGFLADGVATSASSIDLIRGAQDVAWERGKQMMLFNIERGTPGAALAESQLAAFRAEAVIYAATFHQEVALGASRVPRVLLNCFSQRGKPATILPDDYQLGYDLTAAILERGYRRPLFLNLADTVTASRLRADGFIEAARARGRDFSSRVVVAAAPPERGQVYFLDRLLPEALGGPEPTDIIICGQDLMAVPLYFLLAERGLEVGKDIAVASFDNLQPIAGLLRPGLTTMELPYYQMGRAAMAVAIDGPHQNLVRRIRGSLIERGSI